MRRFSQWTRILLQSKVLWSPVRILKISNNKFTSGAKRKTIWKDRSDSMSRSLCSRSTAAKLWELFSGNTKRSKSSTSTSWLNKSGTRKNPLVNSSRRLRRRCSRSPRALRRSPRFRSLSQIKFPGNFMTLKSRIKSLDLSMICWTSRGSSSARNSPTLSGPFFKGFSKSMGW